MTDRENEKYEASAKVVFYSFIIIGVILLALIVL
jgi:hypothetical protein